MANVRNQDDFRPGTNVASLLSLIRPISVANFVMSIVVLVIHYFYYLNVGQQKDGKKAL